jgi:alpha-beta hydrolase superfamily lysophospholipase
MTTLFRSPSWGRELFLRLTVASGVGYLATAYTVSRFLTKRWPAVPVAPDLPEVRREELWCRTADRLWLRGWVFTPPRPRGTVALFHGLRVNRAQMLGRIAFLTQAGYRCVAFDHRAHGQSQGRRASFGYYESRDVEAVTGLIEEKWAGQPAAALGISMGAAALCFAGARLPVYQAFVLEGLYHDLAAAFQHRVGGVFPAWFGRFRRGIIWVTERRLRLRLAQVAPAVHVGALAPRPVLLLTGSQDPHAPPDEVQRLYENCREPREFRLIPGAGHMDVCEQGGEVYREAVLSFLQAHLGG